MSAALKLRLTAEQYLDIERRADTRSEFVDGEMYAMAGASFVHTATNDNIVRLVGNALAGTGCRTLSRNMRVLVERSGMYTYPDLIIICGTPELVPDGHHDTLINPQVIFEITSPSSESYDRGKKFLNYQRIESLKEYVLVSQVSPRVERFVRQDDGTWIQTVFVGLDAILSLASVAVSIPLADIYENVKLSEPDRFDPRPSRSQ
jgi:Uma2 family endonuclease